MHKPRFESGVHASERLKGDDCRNQNVTAALAVANIVKSSLGPVGLDKMLVDDVGETTVTNDGATILKLLEVEHPAAKVLVELAQLQDKEVGDGTTSVVLIAAELLRRANDLVKTKIHPTSIISGYRLASREACKYIQETLTHKLDKTTPAAMRDMLLKAASTSMSSKIVNTDTDFFANMVVDAVMHVKMVNDKGDTRYPIKNCNILKAHGLSLHESQYIPGYALNCTRASQAMPTRVTGCKIALLDQDLRKFKLGLGVQVICSDAKALQGIQDRESDITKERIQMILNSGANVILTTKGIDDTAMKYFVEAGAIAVRRVHKDDMRRIARATGGSILLSMATMEGEEQFDLSALGTCEEVVETRVGDNEMLVFKGTKGQRACSLLLRGANSQMLDEMERSIHDSLCVVKRILESNDVVPGGGAVEAALSIYLENFATTLASREQMAIAEFAQALLCIPKQLAVNAACDATDLVAKLRADHNRAQTDPAQRALSNYGLDLSTGVIRDNLAHGVVEPSLSKVKALQFATEAAITILRIDDMIKMVKEEEHGGH
mmetsp:Transcript_27851/g.64244  ORF Transcript_27851/g.64244 Transcript_27851/m.64244 type:complete len:551 (+) Transcript_27851:17-1669(+)|eukprot:CAMPEP_0114560984 /NCGR_PEP_ID=MMETSP0114-20121206/11760_1 /TAXON_ID=31324 /ORGANISM="Goniomonas sp, Strain m" /LENGTH=550 /DNA_ID=CAMNT_0001746585 /DNA_START=12 /DNA_END=1664 /DNA_ORIENTATION=-